MLALVMRAISATNTVASVMQGRTAVHRNCCGSWNTEVKPCTGSQRRSTAKIFIRM
ncbi:Uncharacterised protein [Bordetella pertussis]|nr:Uncharacterised protein [Bordetella pertussis]CPJ09141.1 Uncharacterised protein [Bordetella pertussis]CPL69164.1 Uncharacterised protein [Bordetella pertussis]CPN00992.1 Uncharacterised protein [Bordetella pertussis]